MPELWPSVVNALRAFVTIGAVALFWIATAWPEGAVAMTWAAITVLLFSPRAGQAYATAMSFTVGNLIAAIFAAIIAFAVLPRVAPSEGFSAPLGFYPIPAGPLVAQPWQTAMFVPIAANFVAFLAPANPMTYDPQHFYNTTVAIIGGSTAAAFAFRLIPHPSP